VKLRAQFDNSDQSLFPNQFVNVSLKLDTLIDVNTAPSAAVQRGSQGTYVYKVNTADSTVKLVPIKTGVQDGDAIQIESEELAAGDQVVTDGADKLKDGGKVTLPKPGDENKGTEKKDATQPEAKTETKTGEPEPSPTTGGQPGDHAPSPNAQGTPDTGQPSSSFVPPPENGQNTDEPKQKSHDWQKRRE
jgi:hypothetical protein